MKHLKTYEQNNNKLIINNSVKYIGDFNYKPKMENNTFKYTVLQIKKTGKLLYDFLYNNYYKYHSNNIPENYEKLNDMSFDTNFDIKYHNLLNYLCDNNSINKILIFYSSNNNITFNGFIDRPYFTDSIGTNYRINNYFYYDDDLWMNIVNLLKSNNISF